MVSQGQDHRIHEDTAWHLAYAGKRCKDTTSSHKAWSGMQADTDDCCEQEGLPPP